MRLFVWLLGFAGGSLFTTSLALRLFWGTWGTSSTTLTLFILGVILTVLGAVGVGSNRYNWRWILGTKTGK